MASADYNSLDAPRPRHLIRPPARPLGIATDQIEDGWLLADQTAITIRAAGPDDAAALQTLVRGLSPKSRYRRFFHAMRELPPDLLAQFTHADPMREISLLALTQQGGQEIPVAMAQYVCAPYPERCDFAVVVADAWQRHGIGKRLLRNLICIASAAGLQTIEGDVLDENEPMRQMLDGMGFEFAAHPDGAYLMRASKPLAPPAWKCSALTALVGRNFAAT